MKNKKSPLSEWISLKTISVTANVVLILDILYLFLSFYGVIDQFFDFLINPFLIFIGWVYLMINVGAVNIFDKIKKYRSNKESILCPFCKKDLDVHKYKCNECGREI